jgi:hypothetical protein
MHRFSFPVAFVYHDSTKPVAGSLQVRVPNFNFCQTYNLSITPRNAFEIAGQPPEAQEEICFELRGVRKPYVIEFDFTGPDEYLSCVLLHPRADVEFDHTLYKDYSTQDVPVRTVNLKHNGAEIGQITPGLNEMYNFRSWVNPYLKSGDSLKFRVFLDFRYIQTVHRDLKML